MNNLIALSIFLFSLFLLYSFFKKNKYYHQVLDLIPSKNLAFKKLVILIVFGMCVFSSYLFFTNTLDHTINLLP